jgi:5-methylcytosine-specific restriction enzyme A
MPKRSPSICNALGCNKLTHNGYCDQHAKQEHNDYADSRQDKVEQAFYKTLMWKKLREYKRNINPLCEKCLLSSKATPMDVVDHIIEIKDDWSKRLDISNLQSLCHSCHNSKTSEEAKKRRNNNNNNNKLINDTNNQVNTNWFLED